MAARRNRIAVWYDAVAAFNIENLFIKKREPGPPRTVYVNEELPPHFYDHKNRVKKELLYSTNQVITSKYTVITFLPRNLLEQFRRIANVFFLGIAILQFFSIFSTVSPGLVIIPLLVVLTITALKDGYEDVKRHQSDSIVNHSQSLVLHGGEYLNSNPMMGKSKTFVRGIVPKRLRRAPKKAKTHEGSDADHHGALPDDVAADARVQSPPPDDDILYDDEPIEEESSPHLFHHHSHDKRPHWKKTHWEDVAVGDVVKIMDNQSFPADILICATSEEENVAFVETKNLDGETNLKSRNACPSLTHLRSAAACADKKNAFRVNCDRPDTNLYKLHAAVETADGETVPVDTSMVLLRGTVLRNTGWIIGIVLFTGEDTKIVLNSGGTPSKRSKVERQMNPMVFINLIILAALSVACGIGDAVYEQRYFPLGAPWLFDDTQSDNNPRINGFLTFLFALINFQNIVPISLYISIEGVRTIQALFIYFDMEMYYAKTDQATLARSWNLSDDLGQIEYIFSDKTGTLTQNKMVFKQCSVGGRPYRGDDTDSQDDVVKTTALKDTKVDVRVSQDSSSGSQVASGSRLSKSPLPSATDPLKASTTSLSSVRETFSDAKLRADITAAAASDQAMAEYGNIMNGFWSTLALCHSVLTSIDKETGAITYKAQSPDEAALVQAAADVGFVFRGRDREILNLSTPFSADIEQYELLNILDFTSARKRMSVIVRKLTGDDKRLLLLSKGADNVIFERLVPGDDHLKRLTEDHLDEFASEGLRTLTLAYKILSEEEYQSWNARYNEVAVALEDRDAKVEAVSAEIEGDLHLLGATAIEDRLQDGVPETIADLKEAGIKIWVATGDKLETAIAIGHSTNLIGRDDNIIIIRGGGHGPKSVYLQMVAAAQEFFPDSGILDDDGVQPNQQDTTSAASLNGGYPLQRINTGMTSIVGAGNGDRPGGFVLVIDGSALSEALGPDQKQLLLRLAMQCEGVICCRVSPLQKALVVLLVKEGLGAMTLAIGDGANDVSMIQAADIGIGISGEEGLQAVNSSDYAIAQFRFLKRLLLVHGHWCYARNSNMIVNFFYKNVVVIGVLWWYQIYCAWSSQYVFEYTIILFWNTFWTIAPVIAIGLFDRILDAHILMALPGLYKHSKAGEYFGTRIFSYYMMEGFVQSALIFFIIIYAYFSPSARSDGYGGYIYEASTTMGIASVMVADLFNGLNTAVWTAWVFFAVFIGIVLIWAYIAIYSVISPGWISTVIYGNDHYLFRSAYFWFGVLIAVCIALLPRYMIKTYTFMFKPSDIDRVRYIHKMEPDHDFTKDRYPDTNGMAPLKPTVSRNSRARASNDFLGSRTDMSTGVTSIHRGFDFATEENGIAMRRMQSNLSELRTTPSKRRRRAGSVLALASRTLRRKKRHADPIDETSRP